MNHGIRKVLAYLRDIVLTDDNAYLHHNADNDENHDYQTRKHHETQTLKQCSIRIVQDQLQSLRLVNRV